LQTPVCLYQYDPSIGFLRQNGKFFDGNALLIQTDIGMDTLAIAGKAYLHFRRIAIGFPKPAASKIAASVFDKSNDIPERIPQKHADFMREFRLRLQPVCQLLQQAVQICAFISDLRQKSLARIVR
jgi:hypothetical protein